MEHCTTVYEWISLFSVLLCVLELETHFLLLVSDNLLITSEQEFDNYAEWDLRDIDFVEDDSDILHGKSHIFVHCLKTMFQSCPHSISSGLFFLRTLKSEHTSINDLSSVCWDLNTGISTVLIFKPLLKALNQLTYKWYLYRE